MTADVVLPAVPPLGRLYARGLAAGVRLTAARRAGRAPTTLPDVACEVRDVPVDPVRLAEYQRLLGLPAADRLPAGFVHVMTFPVQIALMVRPDFPLPPVGMVHVANRVEQRASLWRDDRLDLRVHAADLRPHRSGTQVDLVAEVRRAGAHDVAWRGVSTYLARGVRLGGEGAAGGTGAAGDVGATGGTGATGGDEATAGGGRAGGAGATDDEHAPWLPPTPTASWRLPADTGRRYAEVSGDRNPVHLSAVTARPFGFKRAIAHGMYTAARALAGVGPAAGHTFVWTVDFGKPVLLPATVAVRVAPEGAGFGYAAWQPGASRPYLTGGVTPL